VVQSCHPRNMNTEARCLSLPMRLSSAGSLNGLDSTGPHFNEVQIQLNTVQQNHTSQHTTEGLASSHPYHQLSVHQPHQEIVTQNNHAQAKNDYDDCGTQTLRSTIQPQEVRQGNFSIDRNSYRSLDCVESKKISDEIVSIKLKEYAKYLDDHEIFRQERIQKNAMKKFSHVMQSIRNKYKDRYQLDDDDDDDIEGIWQQSCTRTTQCAAPNMPPSGIRPYYQGKTTEFPNLNRILMRHRTRFESQRLRNAASHHLQ